MVLDKFSLQGKRAIVTGGAGPKIGSSITEAFLEAGATVIIASRRSDATNEYAERLHNQGYPVYADYLDIRKPQTIYSFCEKLAKTNTDIDILVNNAFVSQSQQPEYWIESFQGDMVGLLALSKLVLKNMVNREKGSIINISSIYGVVASDLALYQDTEMNQSPAYAFVKGGMISFTRYLASHYGKYNIRANCLCPGGYAADQPQLFKDRYAARTPLGRMLTHNDIQGPAVFLASDASQYVTGATLMVDGGWTTR